MAIRSLIDKKTQVLTWLLFAFVATSTTLFAQNDVTLQPAAGEPILLRIEATDLESGIHYVRLMLSLRTNEDAAQTTQPRFTVECQDIKGKQEMLWFVSFGGVEDPGFVPPFRATQANLYPPHYPGVDLKMTFEGYIKSKPFTRSWSLLPSGQLRYRNGGADSPNMESARWFLRFLSSLPGLRIVHAKPLKGHPGEIFFPTQPLLDELKKAPICSP
ncbi:MAG TPA: hypothetical protein VFC37_17975 [Terracidiphilus sp.]|jgi:hypothetical protein|nr:hypothetical protein [Terracidiphilus sp.]